MELVGAIKVNHLPLWLEQFIDTYQQLGTDNLGLLSNIYAQDVVFIDPMHHISGFDNLEDYFVSLYTNLTSCTFRVDEVLYQGEDAAIYWTMAYCHPKLNKNKLVTVQGHSKLRGYGDKVVYHRDYLDLGAMIYEHVPLLGSVVKLIKQRANA
ncbi:nuclear transport factor 2 family protein [Thalassotalea euphylliae]|uniref:Nuclear transport factor 2 family protein n=1 Tax=Thalassotalea euphylliae TaxID=1655234 RepID=A0A3E0TQF9_9GAMM|nr:nuclear transport factor 2 family protein [Thalassotalea euphylliae]REL26881.1 nuclear transport factor 2 family protein [Thalassotalea euphylliae]